MPSTPSVPISWFFSRNSDPGKRNFDLVQHMDEHGQYAGGQQQLAGDQQHGFGGDRAAQGFGDQQQRHHRQVLRHQDGQRQPPALALLVIGVLHHLHGDGGRGDRQHEADHDAARHFAAHRQGEKPDRGGDHRACHPGDAQRHGQRLGELTQPHLHPDDEQQQQHAHFGQGLDGGVGGDHARARWTQHHPHQDEAGGGGQPEAAHEQTHRHRSGQEQGDGRQAVMIVHFGRMRTDLPGDDRVRACQRPIRPIISTTKNAP
jgi:hypothetical protein